ncbi:MAG: hypothetical protein LKF82_10160 [Acinetobacter populi]|jgi:PHD/YefM family antitoxin component YafN of YafNO toxin-antitoxin module|uniref:hypothetical protein n=1 Tax=Acinetobacter populi TaxID=1582270 RepID=UPI0023540951|nr:hypothetical protein [Acinetobacter populi]MCH4248172.1 hypothetical protein [Acinetobacter populi]
MSKKKYRNDTEYLLSNPANAKHLMESIAQDKAGKHIKKTMKELLAMERQPTPR